jgi:hypothetical protein
LPQYLALRAFNAIGGQGHTVVAFGRAIPCASTISSAKSAASGAQDARGGILVQMGTWWAVIEGVYASRLNCFLY